MREGQTLAIAGLLQTNTAASTVRVPLLGDLPIVGNLFSKNSISTTETELVVLVTPELIAPIEAHDVPISAAERVIQPTDAEFYLLGRIEGRVGVDERATIRELDPSRSRSTGCRSRPGWSARTGIRIETDEAKRSPSEGGRPMNTRRSQILGWMTAAAWASSALGQAPEDGPAAARAPETRRCGPIRRSIRHVRHAYAEGFSGRPENFAVPPLGFDLNENFRVQRVAADIHVFTLYRSDFYADSTAITPNGLIRLGRLAKELPGWPGPVLVEPVPDRPGLAEARRDAVAGHPDGSCPAPRTSRG